MTVTAVGGAQWGDEGKEMTRFPSDIPSLYAAKPIYDTLGGWDEPTRGATELGQLNSNARKGLEYLEKKLGIPISMVSTGPNRKETIIL